MSDNIDDKLLEWNNNVSIAIKFDSKNNEEFHNYYKRIFKNSLTDKDINDLSGLDRTALDFPIIRPYLLRSLKNVKDSLPSVTIKSLDEEAPLEGSDEMTGLSQEFSEEHLKDEQIADIITQKLEQIRERNDYNKVVYNVGLNSFIGGKGIFKVKTDFQNNFDFKQQFIIESIEDPTTIFFDPAAKSVTKHDSRYVFEMIPMLKEEFNDRFPGVNFEKIEREQKGMMNYAQDTFKWVQTFEGSGNGKDKNKIINICYYFYIKNEPLTLYLLNNGKIVEKLPKDTKRVINKRIIEKKSIYRCAFSGLSIVEEPTKTNFKSLPFVYCPGEVYKDGGEHVLVPYAKHAMDAQRTMNFMANFFIYEALSNRSSIIMVNGGVSKETERQFTNPTKKILVRYSDYENMNGQMIQHAPPQVIPPAQLPSQYMDAFSSYSQIIGEIMGSQFPSLDDTNMSGKALYNLSDFMSSSNEIFMQNLEEATKQVHQIILEAMPDILEKDIVLVNQIINNEAGNTHKINKAIDFNYLFDPEKYHIVIASGINYKLQQQATIEQIIELGNTSQMWAAFLNSPEGIELILANVDLNEKDKWINSFQQWVSTQQQQQSNNPEAAIQNAELQSRQMASQAKLMDAQTRQQSLQLQANQANQVHQQKGQEMALRSASLNQQIKSDSLDKLLEAEKLLDKKKQDSFENFTKLAKTRADVHHKTLSLLKNKQS